MLAMVAFLLHARRPRLGAGTLAIASLLTLLLVACGGGGIDIPAPTATFPPQVAPTQPLLATTPPAAPTQEVQSAQEYVIQPGDTLRAIADQFGVTVEDLAAANDITNPDIIQPGDTLTIPTP